MTEKYSLQIYHFLLSRGSVLNFQTLTERRILIFIVPWMDGPCRPLCSSLLFGNIIFVHLQRNVTLINCVFIIINIKIISTFYRMKITNSRLALLCVTSVEVDLYFCLAARKFYHHVFGECYQPLRKLRLEWKLSFTSTNSCEGA